MITLRDYQTETLNNIIAAIYAGNGSVSGRVVIPTGGGKTFLEAAALHHQMSENSESRIHLVLAPRILLVNQLIDEYRKFASNGFNVAAFHSGEYEPDAQSLSVLGNVPTTTCKADILEALDNAKFRNRDLVVFSTYHSCGRLAGINFDTMIADESQFCVAEGFHVDVMNVSARVKLYFTATEKHTASCLGRGLNNEIAYGKKLSNVTADMLVAKGVILPPRMHIAHCEVNEEVEDPTLDKVIEIATKQHELSEDLGFSKIIFAMNGTNAVRTIEENAKILKSKFPDHDIFCITSKFGSSINGVETNRSAFMEIMRDCQSALIFHYDILSEGIDIDGITGVALLRGMDQTKLQQTIGRAVRLYKKAPELKTCAWVSVPVVNGNEDDLANVYRVVHAIREGGYDLSYDEVVITSPVHIPESDPIENAYGDDPKKSATTHIENIFHEIELGAYWDKVAKSETFDDLISSLDF
jgi:superfamily II DNA or RNA helicase